MNKSNIIKNLREDLDRRYTERIQWTKDTKKKMELVKQRDLINNNDAELLKELKDIEAIYHTGVGILERELKEREEKENGQNK